MKVLIGCEYSGTVRDAFIAAGHDAVSSDLLDTDKPGPHYKGDLFDVIDYPWDFALFHPPCTHLSVSGSRHFEAKKMDCRQQSAVSFFMRLVRASAHIPKTVFEQPISIMSSMWRKPDQIIQPWQFGHGETKATCLWLKRCPPLVATNIVEGRVPRIHHMPPSADRWKLRSQSLHQFTFMRYLRAEIKAREAEYEALEFQTRKAMGTITHVLMPNGKAAAEWKKRSGSFLDQAALKEAHPKLVREFTRKGDKRVFTLKSFDAEGI